jgi:MFS family permease
MKIAADYFESALSKSLGWLVGALVLGTSFPHFLKTLAYNVNWSIVILGVSGLALVGGLLMLVLVPDGPYRKASQKLDVTAFLSVFKKHSFRKAAFGYFGHMWELYAFWTFVPVILATYNKLHTETALSIPLWSFIIIGVGSLSCVLAGWWSQYFGAKRIALIALLFSGLCCVLSPWIFQLDTPAHFLVVMIFWGMAVIADSPMLSSIVANQAPIAVKGTALTIVNCIGFSITILSIQWLEWTSGWIDSSLLYVFLGIGPILGILGLKSFRVEIKV